MFVSPIITMFSVVFSVWEQRRRAVDNSAGVKILSRFVTDHKKSWTYLFEANHILKNSAIKFSIQKNQIFSFFINLKNDVPEPGERVGVITQPPRLDKQPFFHVFSCQTNKKHSFFVVFSVRTYSAQPTCLPRFQF